MYPTTPEYVDALVAERIDHAFRARTRRRGRRLRNPHRVFPTYHIGPGVPQQFD